MPGNFGVTAVNSNRVDLSWNPSGDNVGVSSYRIERCTGTTCTPAEINFAAGTAINFSDTTTAGTTTYRYQIRARDAAGNNSPYTAIITVTTPDTLAPSVPTLNVPTVVSSNRVDLSWSTSTDTGGSNLASYRVERCTGSGCTSFSEIGSTTAGVTSYSDTTTQALTIYRYQVKARDGSNNTSGPSNIREIVVGDTLPPNPPTGLGASGASQSSISLSWTAPTDPGGSGVSHYLLERCLGNGCSNFSYIGTVTGTSTTDTGLAGWTYYTYRVQAVDAYSNVGGYSNVAAARTLDQTLPTAPPGSSASVNSTQIQATVSWSYASDSGGSGVALYRIERCASYYLCTDWSEVGTAPGSANSFVDTSTAGWTYYRYQIRAEDGAGNRGPYSPPTEMVHTPDPYPPPAPTNLQGSVSGTSPINLTWNTVVDTGGAGMGNYRVLRCTGSGCSNFTEVGVAVTGSYSDNAVSPSTTYVYRIRAVDQAANWSDPSNTVTVTTGAGIVINLIDDSFYGSSYNYVSTSYSIYSNGDIGHIYADQYNYDQRILGPWISPKVNMANYEFKATHNCTYMGAGSSPVNTWLTGGASWGVYLEDYGQVGINEACTMTVQIRAIANPSVILDTATVEFVVNTFGQ
jgi:chitodextrinase